jgi:hypothetical protein
MERFAGAFRIGSVPERHEGASTMYPRMFVANNGHILERAKTIERWKDI